MGSVCDDDGKAARIYLHFKDMEAHEDHRVTEVEDVLGGV